MGKFDREIKDAEKIANGWVNDSDAVEGQFIDIKKNNVKWEKEFAKTIQADIDNDAPAEDILSKIESCRGQLNDIEKQTEAIYKKHCDWARGEPRQGVDFICKKLKLDPKSEAYAAVDKALKRVLLDTAKQFASTEAAWTRDLKPAIQIMYNRLNSFVKIALKQETKNDAYVKQFVKDTDAFKKLCGDAVFGLKMTSDAADLKKILDGDWDGQEKIITQKFQSYEKKLESLAKIEAIIEKNYRRIVKSVPNGRANALAWARPRRGLDEELKKFKQDMKFADATYKSLIKQMKNKYADVV